MAGKLEAPAWLAWTLGIRVAISEACGCIMMRGDYTRAAGICPRTAALAAFAIAYNAYTMPWPCGAAGNGNADGKLAVRRACCGICNASCVWVLFGDGGTCA